MVLEARILQMPLVVLPDAVGGSVPGDMLHAYLMAQAHDALDRRDGRLEALKTPEQLAAHAKRMRAFFIEQLGGIPKRTPLNARVTRTTCRDAYTIDHVIFESLPQYYVTGLLYRPAPEQPCPVVLVLCGHQAPGKGKERYADLCALFARNGLAAFCIDPIGQGERHQTLTADAEPRFHSSLEHSIAGVGSTLVARNLARYFVWDAMRAIDYIETRDDLDAARIGSTGGSGGGTQTAYLMALDDRVACAAPRNYMTSLRQLLDTIGPQDAEQNIHRQVAEGMGHGDFIFMCAPRPVLLLTSTRDSFGIQGAWDTFREGKRFYTRLGFPERVDLVEGDTGHGANREMTAALVRWMRRWLLDIDEPGVVGLDAQPEDEDALHCTPGGHVMLLPEARSVFDLNVEAEESLALQRMRFLETASREEVLGKIRATAGIRRVQDLPPLECDEGNSVQRDGYRVLELVLRPEPGIWLPALCFEPGDGGGEAWLYLHDDGKHVEAAVGGPMEGLARQGHVVLAVDVRGIGETAQSGDREDYAEFFGPNFRASYLADMLGRPLLGMRADDILGCARLLGEYGGKRREVHLFATGELGPPALHAAVLEPHLFATVTLRRSVASWSNVVRTPVTRNQLTNTIHGVLRWYDLPDLLAMLPHERVSVVEPVDAEGADR